jgi:hypothetical protein
MDVYIIAPINLYWGGPDSMETPVDIAVEKVQHQLFAFADPSDSYSTQRRTIYSGIIPMGSVPFAGGEVEYIFQFPVLALFEPAKAVGIIPLNDPSSNQFRSAVARASASHSTNEEDENSVSLSSIRADLFNVVLDDPRRHVFAIVLSGHVHSKAAALFEITYHVSVLERETREAFPNRILFDKIAWNGQYEKAFDGQVGVMVRPGVPHQ